MAYKGYYIGSTLQGSVFIQKDGYHICYAPDMTQAKHIIDELTA